MGADYDERTGENEALFREVNERLKERKRDDLAWQAPSEWICQCAEETCTERIEMSPLEYEQLRSEPTHSSRTRSTSRSTSSGLSRSAIVTGWWRRSEKLRRSRRKPTPANPLPRLETVSGLALRRI
jgi:hypothetical protein